MGGLLDKAKSASTPEEKPAEKNRLRKKLNLLHYSTRANQQNQTLRMLW